MPCSGLPTVSGLKKEIENMFSVFLSSYRNTRENFGELEKAVETLAYGSCSHNISLSPKLSLVFLNCDTLLRINSFDAKTNNLSPQFFTLVSAISICIRLLKTKCLLSILVSYGCIQISSCQARRMQQVNELIDNENLI